VARVALEVVDTSGWKQQLRVKRAGSGKTALSSNEIAAVVIRLRECAIQSIQSSHSTSALPILRDTIRRNSAKDRMRAHGPAPGVQQMSYFDNGRKAVRESNISSTI
jgi:hypothetical protein